MNHKKITIITLAIAMVFLISWVIVSNYSGKNFFQLIPSSRTLFPGTTSGAGGEVSPSASPNLIDQTCSEEFYQGMESLTGLRKDSKFSEWKEDCFDRIIDINEEELVDVYSRTMLLLFQCYENSSVGGALLSDDSSKSPTDFDKMFGKHLLCEIYRKGDKQTYEYYEKIRQEFIKAHFLPKKTENTEAREKSIEKVLSKSSPLLEAYKTKKLPEGGCSEIVGEELIKAKEYFCKAVFSKYYLYPLKTEK